jgi:proton-dependent oligopeptide transporter, POT family
MWDVVVIGGLIVTAITIVPVFLQLRQHPRGLHILFFAEMWERFSYYGMRGILIFYMTQHFLFDDGRAQGQFGAYASLVYLMPLIGGFLADRYLGNRKAIAFGALLLVAGHCMMAVEQQPATQTLTYQGQTYAFAAEGRQDARQTWLVVEGQRYAYGPAEGGGLRIEGLPQGAPLPSVLPANAYQLGVDNEAQPFFGTGLTYLDIFYLAMALIIMGVGFLKANISSIVGQLYTADDPRRDSGFTLYYFGINLGAFWASILCAGLGATYGWGWGFGLAGAGMLLGFLVFVRRRLLFFMPGPPQLPDGVGEPPNPQLLKKPILGPINREQLIYLLGLAGVGVAWWLVQREPVVNWALLVSAMAVLAYFVGYMILRCTWVESQRIILALILISAATVFWTLFELAGTALNQFAERNTNLSAGFVTVTAGQTQSFNAGFILIFAPIFAAAWAFLEKRKTDPNEVLKFALGLVQVGAGFLVLVWGAQFADENYRVPLIFLVLLYLLHTTGELCLSPVGLSAMTKLAPAAIVSTVMATWFLSSSAAQALGAQIAKFTAAETVGGRVLDPGAALATYVAVFQQLGWGAVGIGVALGALSPWLSTLAHKRVSGAEARSGSAASASLRE